MRNRQPFNPRGAYVCTTENFILAGVKYKVGETINPKGVSTRVLQRCYTYNQIGHPHDLKLDDPVLAEPKSKPKSLAKPRKATKKEAKVLLSILTPPPK